MGLPRSGDARGKRPTPTPPLKGRGLWVRITAAWYYTCDSIAPVAGLLRDQRGFSQSQIGLLNAVFNLPNIALALIGGILIDRIGAAKAILIAAVIWPSTAMLVEKHRIGTAFGLINMIQSLGLAASNYAAGLLNDAYRAGPDNPGGYGAMLAMFASLSLIAFVSTLLLLLRERRQPGGGIEARVIGDVAPAMPRH